MLAVGAPESAFLDAELIAVDALSVDNLATAVCRQLALVALTVDDIQLAVRETLFQSLAV